MPPKPDVIDIAGKIYDRSALPAQALRLLDLYSRSLELEEEAKNMRALLTRAKNSYINELRSEIIESKSGVNLDDLIG